MPAAAGLSHPVLSMVLVGTLCTSVPVVGRGGAMMTTCQWNANDGIDGVRRSVERVIPCGRTGCYPMARVKCLEVRFLLLSLTPFLGINRQLLLFRTEPLGCFLQVVVAAVLATLCCASCGGLDDGARLRVGGAGDVCE